MTTIESFFVLAALVVFVGILVWRRDISSGRIPRPKRRVPSCRCASGWATPASGKRRRLLRR